MRIRKFFESAQNTKSDISDAFENVEDIHKIKIVEQNPIQLHVEIYDLHNQKKAFSLHVIG